MTHIPKPINAQGPLLVGIAKPRNAARLMRIAALIAEESGRRVTVVHVVTVPEQVALVTAQSSPDVAQATRWLETVIDEAAADGLEADGVIEVARKVHEGLVSAAGSRGAGLLLMGHSDPLDHPSSAEERRFERLMHRVARSAPCDLVVARLRGEAMGRVLVPLAGEVNLGVMGLLARAARSAGAELAFLHVVESDADRDGAASHYAALLETHGLDGLGPLDVTISQDLDDEILSRARAYDLLIVGTVVRPAIVHAILGDRAERIAARAPCTVLVAHARRR